MSTSLSHSGLQPAWKEEVNRRIEAHKHRKGISVVDESGPADQPAPGSRAAAAARVAARYAQAPSFSDMQASDARAAVRAAEAATRAALEAQAAAQAVLDHIENGTEAEGAVHQAAAIAAHNSSPEQHPACFESTHQTPAQANGMRVRWEPDMPALPARHEMHPEPRNSRSTLSDPREAFDASVYESIDAQPIPANLIEFPREIIAPRRMRPRVTEASPDQEQPEQLSIFEVDPKMVSTEPMTSAVPSETEPTWIGSSWQQFELDAQPHSQSLPDYYAIPADDAPKLYQAPFGRRMMAAMVDTALILALLLGVMFLVAQKFDQLPGKHLSEILAVVAVFGLAALYEWFFLTYAKVTPGMRYAQLSLCTFEEQTPTSSQIKARLKAMLISVLPMGLGMLWSIFDEDQMSWHDRLSKTYLRLS